MEVFNVWVCVEKIDEENDENGEDVTVIKLAKYKTEKAADDFAHEVEDVISTDRDKEGFTI